MRAASESPAPSRGSVDGDKSAGRGDATRGARQIPCRETNIEESRSLEIEGNEFVAVVGSPVNLMGNEAPIYFLPREKPNDRF